MRREGSHVMPWDEIYTAARKLRGMSAAATEDLRTNSYWGTGPTAFADGIDNACGGPAGQLASLLNPELALLMATRFEAVGDAWPRHTPHIDLGILAPMADTRRDVLAMARSVNVTVKAMS